MKKTLALLAFAVMSIGSISAQNLQDVVYLKNGSIIRGVVGYVLQIVDYMESYYHYSYYGGGYCTYDYTKENCGGVRIGVSLDF